MKNTTLFIFQTTLTLLLTALTASAGTGVKNGGSGYLCPRGEILLAEHVLASRSSIIPRITDRDQFIDHIMKKIHQPLIKKLLRKQWNGFSDSDHWPIGDPSNIEVYFHEGIHQMTRFDSEGKIPATDPTNSICEFPAYEPELCCTRILISYFDRSESKPERVLNHFEQLDRYQKNILELHEAIYKMAQKIGKIPSPVRNPNIEVAIQSHIQSSAFVGELPTSIVHSLVTNLLIESSDETREDIELLFSNYWQWSNALYP